MSGPGLEPLKVPLGHTGGRRGLANVAAMPARWVDDPTFNIDYHLRQLYRKLDLRSRVELTRLYVEHRSAEPLITPLP